MAATTTETQRDDSVLMLYESYASADVAVGALARAGLSMATVSALGRDAARDELVRDEASSARVDRFVGGGWRRVGPRLNGLVIPGFARLVVLGPLVQRVARALERGVFGGAAGMLREVLMGIGVPDGSVVRCGVAVKRGGVLLLVPRAATRADRTTVLQAFAGTQVSREAQSAAAPTAFSAS